MQLVINTRKGGDAFIRIACLLLVALLPLPTQAQTNIKTKINPRDGAVMVYIPAGEFIMGSDDYTDEKPPHTVYLDGYWIYKYEVTVAQYRKFCNATNRKMPYAPNFGWKDDHPIVSMNWGDATAYAKWASARLPTEAQWEKSARGTAGRNYPWGNKWDGSKCANSVTHRLSSAKPVGSYLQGVSPFGVHDMAGNVSEWCADRYAKNYYKNSPPRNPTGAAYGSSRVLRGGCWSACGAFVFRTAYRGGGHYPGGMSESTGFRCVQGGK